MNRVALNFGIIQIYWYSIFIFLGVLIATLLILKESKKQKINQDLMMDLIFYTVIFGLIGARVYYCIFHASYYLKHPLEIFAIWNGGLAIHGGLLAGILFLCYYTKKHHLNLFRITDMSVVGLIIAQAIGRWGNFFNQEAYGSKVTREYLENLHLPNFIIDGMNINGTYYQPTFLYESLWNILGFIIILIIRKRKNIKVGQLTGFYLIWYSLGRFFIEGLRQDSLMLGAIKVAQLVSCGMLILGITLIYFSKKNTHYQICKAENKGRIYEL